MKPVVGKNHLGRQIVYRIPGASKKTASKQENGVLRQKLNQKMTHHNGDVKFKPGAISQKVAKEFF